MILLDGPMGSELTARGVDTRGRGWSARALVDAPDTVRAVHLEHVRIGAHVLRTNTFRTREGDIGKDWESLAERAVVLARQVATPGVRVAGSLGPVGDCYRLEPAADDATLRAEHQALAAVLAAAGVDLFVCETFPSPREAVIATQVCKAFGLPVWTSLTAGPDGALHTPAALARGARAARDAGASAVLVNCVAATRMEAYVAALADIEVPFGMYANGATWNGTPLDAAAYSTVVSRCLALGARIVGACCGTSLPHLAAARRALEARASAAT